MFAPVFVKDAAGPRTVQTFNCGAVPVSEDACITFVEPLPGLGADREFLVYLTQPGPLYWMQSTARTDLALCVLAPFEAGLDPDIAIDPAAAEAIGASDAGDILVLTVVVLEQDATQTRTNLRAPILVSRSTRRAIQVVLDDPKLPVKAFLADLIARKAPGG